MIEKDKWYSVKEIQEKKMLTMFKSAYSIRKWIDAGQLKAIVSGDLRGKRYKVKGLWLIEFIAKWESGKL